MTVENEFLLNKKIAKLRHCHTIYNKNLDLMYDVDGNQTELRRIVNRILYKIATGELGTSYLAGVNAEIKYAKQQAEGGTKKTKKKKQKKEPSAEEQLAALWKGVNKMQTKIQENQDKQKYLGGIGMLKCQLQMYHRRALPLYKKEQQ